MKNKRSTDGYVTHIPLSEHEEQEILPIPKQIPAPGADFYMGRVEVDENNPPLIFGETGWEKRHW